MAPTEKANAQQAAFLGVPLADASDVDAIVEDEEDEQEAFLYIRRASLSVAGAFL